METIHILASLFLGLVFTVSGGLQIALEREALVESWGAWVDGLPRFGLKLAGLAQLAAGLVVVAPGVVTVPPALLALAGAAMVLTLAAAAFRLLTRLTVRPAGARDPRPATAGASSASCGWRTRSGRWRAPGGSSGPARRR